MKIWKTYDGNRHRSSHVSLAIPLFWDFDQELIATGSSHRAGWAWTPKASQAATFSYIGEPLFKHDHHGYLASDVPESSLSPSTAPSDSEL